MFVQQLVEVVSITAWVLFGLYVVRFVTTTVPQRGIAGALYMLVVQRVVYVFLLVVLSISLFGGSIAFVQPHNAAVVISVLAPDGYRDRPLRSGLRWIVPVLEQVKIYPIAWQTYTMSSKPNEGEKPGDDSIAARTSDGQEVMLDCSVIFQIDPEQLVRINIEWQGRYIEDFIRPLLRGVIRTQVSQYTVDEVNSYKRLDLERDVSEILRGDLREKGFTMDRFILRNISFSPEYAASVERKQMALQRAMEKEHEAEQIRRLAQGEADAIRIKADAQAQALRLIAQPLAGNPNLLTYEYVEKLSLNIRVMLLPANTPYILPIPDMTQFPSNTITSTLPLTITSGQPSVRP
ncbi:MAG: prohibitin family protein [Chloroflexi bacterium]|nr:prohibitin family protein [Chloroflexota bacterium]